MKSSASNLVLALGLVLLGVAIGAAGIYSATPTMRPAQRYWASS